MKMKSLIIASCETYTRPNSLTDCDSKRTAERSETDSEHSIRIIKTFNIPEKTKRGCTSGHIFNGHRRLQSNKGHLDFLNVNDIKQGKRGLSVLGINSLCQLQRSMGRVPSLLYEGDVCSSGTIQESKEDIHA